MKLLPGMLFSCLVLLSMNNLIAQDNRFNKDSRFSIKENKRESRVDIIIDGTLFTSYLYGANLTKPVLYPILTAKGNVITRGWPLDPREDERTDHPHHIGLWFNYGDVNGLDFWNSSLNASADRKSRFGVISHRSIEMKAVTKEGAELGVSLEWRKPNGEVLLHEDTKFIFAGVGGLRTIERITTLTAVHERVLFKDNKEGLLGLRLARELEHPASKPARLTNGIGEVDSVPRLNPAGVTGKYRSSTGIEGEKVWGTRGEWMWLSGKIKNEHIDIIMLDNPANIGFPTHWHARGYGLFAANPFGKKSLSGAGEPFTYELKAGESIKFRYKVMIFSDGSIDNEVVDKEFDKYKFNAN